MEKDSIQVIINLLTMKRFELIRNQRPDDPVYEDLRLKYLEKAERALKELSGLKIIKP